MSASMLQNVKTSDTDVHISQDNQKKINLFAIRNGWLDELHDELKLKQNLLKNLEDAEADVMLLDDTETVPIFIGETFVHFEQEKGLEMMQEMMAKGKEDILKLENRIKEVRSEMAGLKKELYSKFGDSINLECEDE